MGTLRTMAFQGGILILCTGVIAVLSPGEARIWVLMCAAVAFVLFVVVSMLRRRQIHRLAQEIDEILHTGRSMDLSSYSEGDVAVLSNELAKMVERLDRANRQLAQERNALADALTDVSHQIRTPLTAATLMVPKIERAESEEERRHALRDLELSMDRISWLVTSLLKIAKVDAGAIRVERKPVSVAAVAQRAAQPLQVVMDLHDVRFVLDVEDDAAFEGDALWTTEALENILKNCLEHTPPGGTVTLAVREDALACRITITDTGPGIASEDLPHIFERFYRGQGTTHGFGIGLALAQALVSVQGGSVCASNGAAGGARFVVAFPKMVV